MACIHAPFNSPGIERPVSTTASISERYGKLPLSFEANAGQTDAKVDFISRGHGYTLFLTSGAAVLALPSAVLRMQFAGADTASTAVGQNELPGKVNYFIGNDERKWRTNVPTFGKVVYKNLYRGVDVVFYGNQSRLEFDLIVHPGGDPSAIVINYQGTERLEINDTGDLAVHTAAGVLRQAKPFIYQERQDGSRRQVDGEYVFKGRDTVGFEIAAYDIRHPLIIDPVLFYSTFVGGSLYDSGIDISADSAGNAYVVGETASVDFPVTPGSRQPALAGSWDAFVLKLNPTGSGVFYSTYLGGSRLDRGQGVAIDTAGNAYLTGNTESPDFPMMAPQDSTLGGPIDAWVAKLDATGSMLLYSTYLGGNDADFGGQDIAVDSSGAAYVTGETRSSDFPTTPGAFQTSLRGFQDAFVTKFQPLGNSHMYSTFLGGTDDHGGSEDGFGITVDAAGNAYVAGRTSSSDFPVTPGAYDTGYNGGIEDAFATKFNALGSGLLYSTFLGGSDNDQAYDIPIDAAGNAYPGGFTSSTDFPTTAGAFQSANAGNFDVFATKLDPLGSLLLYSTYIGGTAEDTAWGVSVDSLGHAHLTGFTRSTDFPQSANAFQPAYGGGASDAFVTKVNLTGSGLIYSSYLGGTNDDWGLAVDLDALPDPNAYVTGQTGSSDFPITPGSFQTTYGGGSHDGFVTKITDVVLPPGEITGKVTGGGSIVLAEGIGTFGFIVQRQAVEDAISGNLQYVRHASGEKIKSVAFTSFLIVGNTATFGGACTRDGLPCTFNVSIEDQGEPGADDKFVIVVDADPPEGGTLRSGNVKIHE
ncbi:MAG TPA: SBBP repeat-containing protein [Vicinamibacterales bacterium]|nr:SBBP repeat-containing protein [Vicinamibacterales bacterium]